jgi:hypothetical protein
VGSFILVLRAEILESYVVALRSVDYKGKPIIARVAGKGKTGKWYYKDLKHIMLIYAKKNRVIKWLILRA